MTSTSTWRRQPGNAFHGTRATGQRLPWPWSSTLASLPGTTTSSAAAVPRGRSRRFERSWGSHDPLMSQARSRVPTVTDPISLSARTVTLTSYYAAPRRAIYVPLARRIWSYSVDVDGRCRPCDQHLCREALVGAALGSNCQGEGRGFESRRPLQGLHTKLTRLHLQTCITRMHHGCDLRV